MVHTDDNDDIFGSSPTSSAVIQYSNLIGYPSTGVGSSGGGWQHQHHRTRANNKSNDFTPNATTTTYTTSSITLDEFLNELPYQIEENKLFAGSHRERSIDDDDPIMNLVRRVELDRREFETFVHFDYSRGYTRNLVATDNKHYTLLILCWTPGKFSPIHDHPCDGCWMKVLQGEIQECRYKKVNDDNSDSLVCIQDTICKEGETIFIEDSLGYHKVGNPSSSMPAITLHLYCPPFQSCNIWLDENRKPVVSSMCYFSENGVKR